MAASQADLSPLAIRRLESLEEFRQTQRLQKLIWGFDESDAVASRLFGVFTHIGGSSLGAFLGNRMVGYTLAFAAFKPNHKPYWHSHMAGVDPTVHGLGIGYLLKLRQREEALAAGLDRIEWTFDPLQSRNAFFNIEKLGVEIVAHLPNFYGVTSSELHGALPTDRLVAAWHLRSPAVAERAAGARPPSGRGSRRIEIPTQISAVPRPEAEAIQRRVGEQFRGAFAEGLEVVGFERGPTVGAYHLGRTGSGPRARVSG